MSSSVCVASCVGLMILVDKMPKKIIDEVSGMEPRFDRKTGKPIEPEKVILSEERTMILFNGEEYDDEDEVHDMISDMANLVGRGFGMYGTHDDNGTEIWFVTANSKHNLTKAESEAISDLELELDADYQTGKSVLDQIKKLNLAAKKLKKLKVPFIGPMMFAAAYRD